MCRVKFFELIISESGQGVTSDGGKEKDVLEELKKEDLTAEHFPLLPEDQEYENAHAFSHLSRTRERG